LRILLTLALAWVAAGYGIGALAQGCHGTHSNVRVLIDVQGVRSDHGFVVANLYGPDKSRFLADNGWLDVWRDPARAGGQTMCLYMSGPGYYALVMFHDANANGVLDQGLFGIPLEGFGFSNNVRPFLMAPSLKSASFYAGPGDTRLQIRLRYP
jgi:uncharacterized protein (DUF2141 family)